MTGVVLDASALLALINREPGADLVKSTLPDALMSAVNLAEAVRVLCRTSFSLDEATTMLSMLIGNVIPFERPHAYRTGILQGLAHTYGLSLGDCACLSLAMDEGLPVLTADSVWSKLSHEIEVEVRLIR